MAAIRRDGTQLPRWVIAKGFTARTLDKFEEDARVVSDQARKASPGALKERGDGSGRGHGVPEVAIECGPEARPMPNLGCLTGAPPPVSRDRTSRATHRDRQT